MSPHRISNLICLKPQTPNPTPQTLDPCLSSKLIRYISVTYVFLLTPERMRVVMLHNSVLSVPAKISSNIRLSSAITPWIGSTFSSTLRVFCVELRAALRSEDRPPVAHDSNDSAGDDDGLAASLSCLHRGIHAHSN